MMWRVTEAPLRLLQRSVLFLCGVQLVLRSGVLTVIDLDKVDVTPSLVEVFRSVLSGVGGSTGGWRCCWDAPSLTQLPPATPKNPSPYISLLFVLLFVCFCSDGINQHKDFSAGLFSGTFQQPNPFCCNRSTTNLFIISFISRTLNFSPFFLSLWIYLWLAETSYQLISQTTWLKVTPHCSHYHSKTSGSDMN